MLHGEFPPIVNYKLVFRVAHQELEEHLEILRRLCHTRGEQYSTHVMRVSYLSELGEGEYYAFPYDGCYTMNYDPPHRVMYFDPYDTADWSELGKPERVPL